MGDTSPWMSSKQVPTLPVQQPLPALGYLPCPGLKPLVPSKLGAAELAEGQQGKPLKIVYLLTVSGRATRQVLHCRLSSNPTSTTHPTLQVYRLIRRLYSPNHYILVHVDSRAEYMHRYCTWHLTLCILHPIAPCPSHLPP